MFIFEFGGISVICGSGISTAEVWIKVCNTKCKEQGGDFRYQLLPSQAVTLSGEALIS
jgi:hypothetical protein